ncbi:MAG: hypothetical protein HY791_11030 [Deltaproteobacteria bacterium]|nr:hypothetical protein [Deltaproteobacteria bacterium]
MSPEQVSGSGVDFRSDLYALGCILHQLVCGEPPFSAPQALTVMMQHLGTPPPANGERPWRDDRTRAGRIGQRPVGVHAPLRTG